MAANSASLAASLSLDLRARAAPACSDTAAAVSRWEAATRRYAVLETPFGLVASLWPSRAALVRVVTATPDTTAAARACRSFSALIGFTDQATVAEVRTRCAV